MADLLPDVPYSHADEREHRRLLALRANNSLRSYEGAGVLGVYTVAELPDGTEGLIVYCSNGDAGSPCLAVHNGTDWLRVALGSAVSPT